RERAFQNVAWWQYAQLVTQLTRAAAAVEHGDDRIGVQPRVVLEAAEQARQTSAAAKTSDVQLAQAHRCHIVVRRYNAVMSIPDGVRALERELREICGTRLQSLVIYGQRTNESRTKTDAHAEGHGDATVRTM